MKDSILSSLLGRLKILFSPARSKNSKEDLAEIIRQASAAINASKAARNTYKNLWDAEVRVFSQWGEDRILDYLFDVIGIAKPKIIEFGAGNFIECNSRFAAEYRNASTYVVDMREDLLRNVKSLDIYWRNSIFPVQDFITPDTARKHLQNAKDLMGGVDTLSIDIDGNDYWVLDGLDLSGIDIVVCEYNPLYGSKIACSVPRDDNYDRTKAHWSYLHYGMSLRAAIFLMTNHGLVFIGTNRAGNNAFFVQEKYIELFNFKIPDLNELEIFVDWRVRESRDEVGILSYLPKKSIKEILFDLELIEITKKTKIRFSDTIC